jgi:UDP-N-acetylglucosamine:LPS N-acetylglucosamine transferase
MKKHIHIWFTKAGGGHESSAKTFRRLIEEYYPQYTVRLIDLYEMEPKWYQKSFEKSYPLLIEKFPFIWRILNIGWKYQWFCGVSIGLLPYKAITQWFERENPVLVISTYYSLGQIHSRLDSYGESKYVTVVSDIFTPMRPWFLFQSNVVVFSDRANAIAVKHGVNQSNIHQTNLLVNPKFQTQLSPHLKEQFSKSLKLCLLQKTIMILGGGEGLPNGVEVLCELLKLHSSLNIIVVCGRNATFKHQCDMLNISTHHRHNVHIYGFVDTIYELMSVSDIIITKAGPGAILEAAAMGKYLLLCYAIPPQELGNVDFVVEKGLGEYIPNAKLIVARLAQLLPQLPIKIQHTIDFEKHPKKLVDFLIDKTL